MDGVKHVVNIPKQRDVVLLSRSKEFLVRCCEYRIRLAEFVERQAGVHHEVAGAKHDCRHALDGGDLFDVLDTLDTFYLRNQDGVAVVGLNVEWVAGVQRVVILVFVC